MTFRILVVDDDANTLVALSSLLRMGGHDVETCEAPGAALEQLRGTVYDVLLTDQMMAGMRGLELAREALELQPALRCLVVSGSQAPPPAERAHVEAWVSKPVDVDVLLDAIEAGSLH